KRRCCSAEPPPEGILNSTWTSKSASAFWQPAWAIFQKSYSLLLMKATLILFDFGPHAGSRLSRAALSRTARTRRGFMVRARVCGSAKRPSSPEDTRKAGRGKRLSAARRLRRLELPLQGTVLLGAEQQGRDVVEVGGGEAGPGEVGAGQGVRRGRRR